MDLAAKSYGLTAPRQANAWISIFDKLQAFTYAVDEDELTKMAVEALPKIKELYLEEMYVL